ncbi:MAG: exosome complex RNA-binding protein Csl4 [Conexivisphaera sp.]|jgi:exosome complex component CSL4
MKGTSAKDREGKAAPGDGLAVIEEAIPLGDFYVDLQGIVRATKVSTFELKALLKELKVRGIPMRSQVPKPGDYVVGTVDEDLPEDMYSITIYKINNEETKAGITAILVTGRRPRGRGEGAPVELNDIVRAKILGVVDGMAFAALSDDRCGVLWTRCSRCGGKVARQHGGYVRCLKCGNREYRRLAPDFLSVDAIS